MHFKSLLALAILSLVVGLPVQAAEDWIITSFNSDLAIQPSGQVKVTETIQVDYGSVAKHGIFRDLPMNYQDNNGNVTYTELQVVSVQRDSHSEPYTISKNKANMRIKIGDADKTITGAHTYVITYNASGVLLGFPKYDELYWNVTGTDWPVPIQKATATVTLPAPAVVQAACYQGYRSSTDPCQQKNVDKQTVQFTASRPLELAEGLTVAVGYTRGLVPLITVAPPKTMADVMASSTMWMTAGLCAVIGMGWLGRRWYKYGRDPKLQRTTVVAEYESPDNLRPAEIGTLLDERADTKDVSATIVDLAVRGFMTIKELPKTWLFGKTDYEFTRTDKVTDGLLKYEKLLLDKLFDDGSTVAMSDLKQSFYKDLAKVKEAIYREVVDKKLFIRSPETARNWGIAVALLILVVGGLLIAGGVKWLQDMMFGAGLGVVISGIVGMYMAQLMPKRTLKGREMLRQAQGYKLFVSGTEKYRQPYFENHNIFMDVLPYAMVFGVTAKLVEAFKEMGIEPPQPTWYVGPGPFSFSHFDSQLNSMSNSLSSAMASTPSSSGSGGGGFSGGGAGGGGGGSW